MHNFGSKRVRRFWVLQVIAASGGSTDRRRAKCRLRNVGLRGFLILTGAPASPSCYQVAACNDPSDNTNYVPEGLPTGAHVKAHAAHDVATQPEVENDQEEPWGGGDYKT